MNARQIVFCAFGLLFLAACTVRIEVARLGSPDLTFTALDGAFKARAGDRIPVPGDTPYCYDNASFAVGSIFMAGTPIAAQSNVGRERGAALVRIDIAGVAKPLYGLLLFCAKPSSALEFSRLSTKENIVVPERQRARARSGQVALVPGVYKIKMIGTEFMQYYSSILWLADSPEKLK
jgi:hypothetical protein